MKTFAYIIAAGLCGVLAFGSTSCSMLRGSKKVKQEAVLPHDRQKISTKDDIAKYTSEDIKHGVVKGDWAIETVNGKPAVGETAPFLKFVPGEKTVYGNNGCNSLVGPYQYNPKDSTLSFGDMAATMRLCSKQGITDYEINAALAEVKSYSWDSKNSEYYLHLYNAARKEVMTLMHQNFDFLAGTWLVKQIDSTPVNNPDMEMVIDVDEGKIHGNTGCNIYNGSLEIDMDQPNSISFSAIGMTRMACPPDAENHETQLIVALEEASSAKPVSPSEVLLFNGSGEQVLRLVRLVQSSSSSSSSSQSRK